MTRDVVLITVESLRYDYRGELSVPPGFEMIRGVANGHYTRPSLAALHSGSYRGAIDAQAHSPTLAERLSRQGYTTIGVSYSPQTASFGFDTGFDEYDSVEPDDSALGRGSALRERLGSLGAVRWLHRRLNPKSATLDSLPPDGDTVETAIERYQDSSGPRFLWVHLMDSHRPYGRGDDALPDDLDRRAAAAGPNRTQPTLGADAHRRILETYREGLHRANRHIQTLLDAIDSDARVVIAGDHGEEFGEEGYYYHPGYRRRLPDTITDVPVAVRNADVDADTIELVDIPEICVGESVKESERCVSFAPWGDRVRAKVSRGDEHIVIENGAREVQHTSDESHDLHDQLRALGYSH